MTTKTDKPGCMFELSWVGPCGKPRVDDSHFCTKHEGMRCRGCGKQAVRDCDASMGLMCGEPLCGSCGCTMMPTTTFF